jgi:hypothetical protein
VVTVDGRPMRIRTEGLSWQQLEDEVVLLDLESGSYLRLNHSAAVLWTALAEGADVTELSGRLEREFGLPPEQATADAQAFVAELLTSGLLVE